MSKSRSSSFEQTKPFDPSNGNGNGDFAGHGAPSNNSSGQKEQNNKHLQAHSPDLIPERGKLQLKMNFPTFDYFLVN